HRAGQRRRGDRLPPPRFVDLGGGAGVPGRPRVGGQGGRRGAERRPHGAGGRRTRPGGGLPRHTIEITGKAPHAGLEPELGVNAAIELAHQVLALAAIADASSGTTVTPTMLSAGTTANTVPARATIEIDSRAATLAEQQRVASDLRELRPHLPGASLEVVHGVNSPPLEERSTRELFALAQRLGEPMGISFRGVAVGGGSD